MTYFFENIIVLTTMKWAPTFSSIHYEQVALLHPPNRPASYETEEFFAQTCSTCLEEPYRKDSSGAHPCRAIDRAWEPRIPSPCSLKAITHATGSKIGSSQSRWNRGTKYYPVGMKTHIEYLDIFFFENIIVLTTLKWAPTFSSIHYEQVSLLQPPNRLASYETEEFFTQTCSTCLEAPYRIDSSGAHPCRAIDRA